MLMSSHPSISTLWCSAEMRGRQAKNKVTRCDVACCVPRGPAQVTSTLLRPCPPGLVLLRSLRSHTGSDRTTAASELDLHSSAEAQGPESGRTQCAANTQGPVRQVRPTGTAAQNKQRMLMYDSSVTRYRCSPTPHLSRMYGVLAADDEVCASRL